MPVTKRRLSGRAAASAFALTLCTLALGACTNGDDQTVDRTGMLPDDQRVSSVPWNKPQGWENQSQLGALANNPRIGGGADNTGMR